MNYRKEKSLRGKFSWYFLPFAAGLSNRRSADWLLRGVHLWLGINRSIAWCKVRPVFPCFLFDWLYWSSHVSGDGTHSYDWNQLRIMCLEMWYGDYLGGYFCCVDGASSVRGNSNGGGVVSSAVGNMGNNRVEIVYFPLPSMLQVYVLFRTE